MFSSVTLKGYYELCSIWNSTETKHCLIIKPYCGSVINQIVTGIPDNMKIYFAKYPFGQSYINFVTNKKNKNK